MGLLEEIEDTKKKLAEAVEAESSPEPEEKISEEPVEESKPEIPAEEKPEETEPVVENPTAADFARMRREKKAKEREADDLRRQLEEARKPVQVVESKPTAEISVDPEPDRATKYEAWLEWNLRDQKREIDSLKGTVTKTTEETNNDRLVKAAVDEFQNYEQDFRAITPEYDQAAEFYTRQLSQSIKMLNPSATTAQIGQMIKNTVLSKASNYARQGLDPAEELFNEAVSFGFTAPSDEQETVEIKPKLSKVAENRARNAGTAGAKGRGGVPQHTRETAAEMTNAEWVRLPIAEKRRILGGG